MQRKILIEVIKMSPPKGKTIRQLADFKMS